MSRCGNCWDNAPMEIVQELKPYLNGIVSSACYRRHTCHLEGVNNKIKVIKRTAHGYRNAAYFFSKSEMHFPVNSDEPKNARSCGRFYI